MIELRTRSFLLLAAILPGWGDHFAPQFDTPRIIVANHSVADRSSLTYINYQRKTLDHCSGSIQEGDYNSRARAATNPFTPGLASETWATALLYTALLTLSIVILSQACRAFATCAAEESASRMEYLSILRGNHNQLTGSNPANGNDGHTPLPHPVKRPAQNINQQRRACNFSGKRQRIHHFDKRINSHDSGKEARQ